VRVRIAKVQLDRPLRVLQAPIELTLADQ
jgi:hypothetical protein